MLDFDDSHQIALADRGRLLTRAAEREARWRRARASAGRALADWPAPPGGDILWLHLPYPLTGVGSALQACAAASSSPMSPRLWSPGLADLAPPGSVLDFAGAGAPDGAVEMEAIDLATHPGELFLFLLSLLDGWSGGSLGEEALRLGEDALASLARCRAEVSREENPAKRLAGVLSERLPVFWSQPALEGVAFDWRQRTTRYAECRAAQATAAEMRHVEVMARFPRYWPQAVAYVYLTWPGEASPPWLAGFELLVQRRRLRHTTVRALGPTFSAAVLYLLELGEWVALYGAILNGVDPQDRVPLDLLSGYESQS